MSERTDQEISESRQANTAQATPAAAGGNAAGFARPRARIGERHRALVADVARMDEAVEELRELMADLYRARSAELEVQSSAPNSSDELDSADVDSAQARLGLSAEMGELSARMQSAENALAASQTQLAKIDQRLLEADTAQTELSGKLGRIEQRVQQQESLNREKLNGLQVQLKELANRIGGKIDRHDLEERLSSISGTLENHIVGTEKRQEFPGSHIPAETVASMKGQPPAPPAHARAALILIVILLLVGILAISVDSSWKGSPGTVVSDLDPGGAGVSGEQASMPAVEAVFARLSDGYNELMRRGAQLAQMLTSKLQDGSPELPLDNLPPGQQETEHTTD